MKRLIFLCTLVVCSACTPQNNDPRGVARVVQCWGDSWGATCQVILNDGEQCFSTQYYSGGNDLKCQKGYL